MSSLLFALFLVVPFCQGQLSGDHVCTEETRYVVNVTEYFLKNSTVRSFQWCLNVPPRCSVYSTRLRNESRIVEKEVTSLIDKCCSGYVEDSATNTCHLPCPDCKNGTCKEGKCSCFPGHKGELCHLTCDIDEWGSNCQNRCLCSNTTCNPITGQCLETPQTIDVVSNGKFSSIVELPTSPIKNVNVPETSVTQTSNKKDLVSSASAATAIAVGVIVSAVVIVLANHVKKKKGNGGVPTVAVYTHSIFHTPLPDPPPTAEETKTFEARVVCSMNFPAKECYLYDHPPSTGSYRAASVPEPPDLESGKIPSMEPLYDEIPAGILPIPISQPPSSLYMNTISKTRL